MSAVSLTRPRLVDQLAIGISRLGGVRHGHWKARFKKPQPEKTGYSADHGEQIYIFSHVRSDQVVYSHSRVLDAHKALSQIPFAGKKTKPAKIRKDLWRHLAMVQFPPGQGAVGRSVFAKLREFRRRHELEWGDELLFGENEDGNGGRHTLSRRERGLKVHEQKANAVADLAAVLAGAGKSNKMWLGRPAPAPASAATTTTTATTTAGEDGVARVEVKEILCDATVYWANTLDREHAESWSANVAHSLLPTGADWLESKDLVEPLPVEEKAAKAVAEKA